MVKYSILFLVLLVLIGSAHAMDANNLTLMMATTTSTDNTGLLDLLAARFKRDTGIELRWVAVGTGKALELGKNCDVDILLVHAPAAEEKFMAQGYGVDRRQIMYNDFVIIGPKSDPANIKGLSAAKALEKIARSKAIFVSRGDDSGTNKKELTLWREAGIEKPDRESWYIQTGQGMIATINVAAERGGYTLTDRGTFIKYEEGGAGDPPLVVLVEGDPALFNQYSVMIVSPKNCSDVRLEAAKVFSDWIVSPAIQKFIGDFKLMGKRIFTPNAKN